MCCTFMSDCCTNFQSVIKSVHSNVLNLTFEMFQSTSLAETKSFLQQTICGF